MKHCVCPSPRFRGEFVHSERGARFTLNYCDACNGTRVVACGPIEMLEPDEHRGSYLRTLRELGVL
jgi:hypothetical protein